MDHSQQLVVLFLGLLVNAAATPLVSQKTTTSKPSNVSTTLVSSNQPAAHSPKTSPEVITSPPLRKVVLMTVTWDKKNPCKGPVQCNGVTISKTPIKQSEAGYSGELAAYKAITGLLLVLVLAVLLQRYGRPTYAAIRQRLSQKRQSRWVGPTQSQSVHYHREQQAGLHPNNNTSKRHSYPALEKLTVSTSREPSSNRNSDYSYN